MRPKAIEALREKAGRARVALARRSDERRRAFPTKLANRLFPSTRLTNKMFGEGRFIRLQYPPYPPSAKDAPRYGYGRPAHARLAALLGRGDAAYRDVLGGFRSFTDGLLAIPRHETDPSEPHWQNRFLFGLDGISLYCFTRERSPRRYLEVGSGNSTLFVHRARRDGDIDTEIVSIDPHPRVEIDVICDTVVRQPLESVDLGIFGSLQAGDIVFLDGTHRAFMNSDATVFFLDVLPELPPGVLVGIHDVHLPDDYRPDHADRYYSEQYLLAAYLLADSGRIRPVLPCWYVSHHPELSDLARSLVPQSLLPPRAAGHAAADGNPYLSRMYGVIFWFAIEPGR